MKFIVKLFPEISIKSKPVRRRFSKLLEGNIRNVLKRIDEDVRVKLRWDRINIDCPEPVTEETRTALTDALRRTPGISRIEQVRTSTFTDLHDIYEQTQALWQGRLVGKTFCVRVRRVGQHDFSSTDAERYVGGGLNQHNESLGVKLSHPDVTVKLEIEHDQLHIVEVDYPGLGGFPIATQEDVLSLISGGFDSAVASYDLIRRGSRVHYLFFNLGGVAHEVGVKQMASLLWQQYGSSHRVKFISVPFDDVVQEILENVDNGQMGVVLKRMMMRAAAKVAERMNIKAIVTGEALGQVSSQTLTNLSVIDNTVDTLILRPLIASDKQQIIDQCRIIGVHDLAASMPEYCGVISQRPTVKAIPEKIVAEEAKCAADVIDKVLDKTRVYDINQLVDDAPQAVPEIEVVHDIAPGGVIVDIRGPEEEEHAPLSVSAHPVKHIPFYKLANAFTELDPQITYYLYCDRGVMSRLQAAHLLEQGHQNVKVYRRP